jgi:DNA polymerase-3 subunit alpha
LIRAGAFDCFGVDRATLQASVGLAWESAEQAEASAMQVSLFDGPNDDLVAPLEYVKVTPWTDRQKLIEEKNALGFYLSGHLFSAYEKEVRQFIRTKLSGLEPSREPRIMSGMIAGLRTQMTQRGKLMIVTLDDGTAVVEVSVYNDIYEPNRHMFKEDELLIVQGKVSEDRFNGGLRISAEKVLDLGAARIQHGKRMIVSLKDKIDLGMLKDTLTPHRQGQGLPFVLRYANDNAECEVELGSGWQVDPSDALQISLGTAVGQDAVKIEY